ncbi:hypothetical protein [Xanthobacter sp. 126]|uniref:hypothetical protein n=1 Tax=Xanthobacter sp. 126 TaxID=1131814 RepID=UPI00045EB00F|nr:hypothetical protein [Xanthobacter sp. 126]
MGLAEALVAVLAEGGTRPFRLTLPEEQAATLKDVAQRYAAGCPFKPGDLVTPRAQHNIKGAGLPQVVLEVIDDPLDAPVAGSTKPSDYGNPSFGARLDLRTAGIAEDGTVCAWWGESWQFEPYVAPEQPPAAAPEPAAA